jgi:hypothetical protein
MFRSCRAPSARCYRPRLEILEDRCVPTTLTPTTFADGGLGSGSLRDAVLQFNADPGSDDDIIQLQAGTYALTLQNTGGHHETAGLEGDLNITSAAHRLIIQGAGSSGANATIVDASQLQDRAFQIVNPGTQVVFQHLVIQGGLAQDDGSDGALAGSTDALGGGILNNGGDVTLDHAVVQNNVAQGDDAVFDRAPGHNARGGGCYSSGGQLTIVGATIGNNQALGGRGGDDYLPFPPAGTGGSAGGGGLYATGGSLDISDSMITGNGATGGRGGDGFNGGGGNGGSGEGGGLYVNGGSLTIATSTIASNQVTGGHQGAPENTPSEDGVADGGGLYNGGTLAVTGSTLAGNSAAGYNGDGVGGIFNDEGTLTVSNSTLSGNTGYSGGGIYNSYGTLTVSNSTLSGNNYAAIANLHGTLTLSNSIVAGNAGDPLSGFIDANHNLIGGNPLLGPLQDNGGPTKTRALLADSPALNAGDTAQLGVADQRGVVRSGGVNIGAYQASATAFALTAPATATAGTPFDLTVKAVDPFGQTALGYTGRVTFTSADPYGATLPTDYTFAAADQGVHLFPGAATLYTASTSDVTATDTSTGSITGSASLSVNPAAADHLLFLQQPTDTPAGQTLSPVMVEVVDAFGNVETGDNSDTITLSLGTNLSGGTLGGTLSLTVVNGVATFSDLSIDLAGTGYTLHAAIGGGLPDIDSDPFNIT